MLSILAYHYFQDDGPLPPDIPKHDFRFILEKVAFARHLEYLATKEIKMLAPGDLEASERQNRDQRACLITIDDGHVSSYEIAFPLLEKIGYKAIYFVPRGKIGDKNSMDWHQLRELVRMGHEIGAHGDRHVPLHRLCSADLDREIKQVKVRLEDGLGKGIRSFALPMGYAGKGVIDFIRKSGYQYVFTSWHGYNLCTKGVFERFTVKRSDGPGRLNLFLRDTPLRRIRFSLRNGVVRIKKEIISCGPGR